MKHHPILRLGTIALILLLLFSSASIATTFYVIPSGRDSNNGMSWQYAFKTITKAISVARADDEIWVAEGIYAEPIALTEGIKLYGGFDGTETALIQRSWNDHLSIIQAYYGYNDPYSYGSYSAIRFAAGVTDATVIDGFNITGAYTNYGGGINCRNASPTIRNNYIWDNYADYGGGIYCYGASSRPAIENNTVTQNSAVQGGGIFSEAGASPVITDNRIIGNNASEQGGGIRCSTGSWSITGNFISRNLVTFGNGGGIYLDSTAASGEFTNNIITGNSVRKGNGGGIYAIGCYTTMMQNSITGNSASGYYDTSANFWAGQGGGIYCAGGSFSIISSNISANGATLGGGVMVAESSTVKIINDTITANSASEGGGICSANSSPSIINTIIAFNASGIRKDVSSNLVLRSNCVYGNTNYNYSGVADPTGVTGNISVDPQLADWKYGNVHIQVNSPCTEFGDNTVVPVSGWTDIDGNARRLGARVDIGADESDNTAWPVDHNIIRVSRTGDDANDGSSWAQAKRTVQDAIDAAATTGGEVWVANGTYYENVTVFPYTYIYGGFQGSETNRAERDWRSNVTALAGSRGSTVSVPAGYLVSGIDGCTIRGGRGTIMDTVAYGGAIYCYYASPTIANNTIQRNSANYGGAIYCNYSSAEILNNRFVDNDATYGAAIYCDNYSIPTISGNTITGNDAVENGGAIACGKCSSPRITGNAIIGNIARRFGGAVYSDSNSSPRVFNNVITANTSAIDGGSLYFKVSFPTVIDNVITGNTAFGRGGAIFLVGCASTTIANNTMSVNKANRDGGAIYVDAGTQPNIVNNIVAFNSSGIYSYTASSFKNNCVYGNTGYQYGGITDLTGTNGNISEDPKLADDSFKDTHIQPDSPCVDKGFGGIVQPEWVDMDGQNRVQGSSVDIGADESDGTLWALPARIVRVSPEGSDTYDGSSWAYAKRTIQAAIDVASVEGGEIWVKSGTYRERVTLRPYAYLYGGFNGTETDRGQRSVSANETILDGNQAGTVVTVPMGGIWSGIDGFTITRGKAEDGGGIYCYYASPTIANCVITGNTASKGSGIFCNYSAPVITDNRISENTAGSGGGVFCFYSSPTITKNIIKGNQGGNGGGIICYYSTPIISNNTINGNSGDAGGGVFCNNESPATIINNIINNNIGRDYGGGIYCDNGSSAYIYNNTIVANSSDQGGGVYINGCSPVMVNNIIAYGTSGVAKVGGGTATIRNCSFFGNTSGNFIGLTDQVGRNGNIGIDPQLVSVTNGNLHLNANSPCINTGDSSVVKSSWVDLDLKARIYGSAVDIGADEWSPVTSGPSNVSLSPNSGGVPVGNASKSIFVATYSDPDGYTNLSKCFLLINTTLTGTNGIYVYYNADDRKLYVRNDANNAWIGGFAPGSNNIIENAQCKLYAAGTTVKESGSTLTISWKIEIKPTMSGKKCYAWMLVDDDESYRDGWDRMGAISISRPPVNVNVVFSGGAVGGNGTSMITARYSDPDGATNITGAYLLINTVFNGANGIYLCYSENLNKLYLQNDTNTAWLGGFAPGSANVIQNSYVKVNCATTTISKSGTDLIINWSLDLKPPMARKTCSAWMLVTDDVGLRGGWDQKATITIGQVVGTQPPVNVKITPNSGALSTGIKKALTSVYSDADGVADLAGGYMLLNTQFSGANAVYLWYDFNNRKLYLRNDQGTSWGTGGAIGSSTILENSNCKVYCADATATESTGSIAVKYVVELKRVMSGKTCRVWQKVYDDGGLYDGWDQMATFDIIGQPPSVGTLSAPSSILSINTPLMFTSKYSDPDGYTDLADCYFLINTKYSGANGVYVWYDQNQNKLYVRNDANTVWTGGYAPGSANIIENSYFRLYCEGTSVTGVGTQLTINWKIELKPTFSGKTCGAWMAVYDDIRLKGDWRQVGSYTTK